MLDLHGFDDDRLYYHRVGTAAYDDSLVAELAAAARKSEALLRESRRLLVTAVRRGAAAGMSQRQIARAVGRSQPEVSRLLRFQPASPRGRALASRRAQVIEAAAAAGFSNVRVFGSVARGDDGPGSDIDLLVSTPAEVTLLDLARLEHTLSALVGERVEVTPDRHLRATVRGTALDEAVPL